MMRRHAIAGVACVGLMFFLVGVIDARVPSSRRVSSASRSAEVKTPPPASPTARTAAGAVAGAAAATALRIATPLTPPAAAAPATSPTAVPPAPAGAPASATAAAPATSSPAAAPAAPPAYNYTPAGKTDPFAPFVEIDLAVKKEKEKKALEEALRKKSAASKRPISPLQLAEIEKFRLVGIAGDDQRRMAVVEDGVAKKYYPLFVGTHIGPNGGRIVAIQPDRVIVEEPLPEAMEKGKKAQTRRITVMLHKEEEGKP